MQAKKDQRSHVSLPAFGTNCTYVDSGQLTSSGVIETSRGSLRTRTSRMLRTVKPQHKPSENSGLAWQIRGMEDLEAQLFSDVLRGFEERIGYFSTLAQLWNLIKERYSDEELHLTEAARSSGMSANNLNRVLRRCCGQTFHQLLNRYRILKAVEIMQERDDTLLEIALTCGFGSQLTLERNSKKYLGIRPKDLRKLVANHAQTHGD